MEDCQLAPLTSPHAKPFRTLCAFPERELWFEKKDFPFRRFHLLHLLLCEASEVVPKLMQVHAIVLRATLVLHKVRTVLCRTK